MRLKLILKTTIAFGLFCSTSAFADNMSSPWSFSAAVGTEVPVNGEFLGSANSNTITLSTLNTNLSGTGVVSLRGIDYSDAYDQGTRATIEVRYALSELTEIFGAASYYRANGKNSLDFGCIIPTLTGVCGESILGQVTDLEEASLEIGYRQWFGTGLISQAIRPYYALRVGVAHSNAIDGYYRTATLGGLAHVRLYDATTTYVLGADLGATYTITRNLELAAEIGVRYTGDLEENDTYLDAAIPGVGSINDSSSRLSVPVSVKLNAVF